MQPRQIEVYREAQIGKGNGGDVYQGDACLLMPELLETYRGQVQLIYIDPPFATGKQFVMKMRVGEKENKSGAGSLNLPAYDDASNLDDYLSMMREVLNGAHELLSDAGTIFLHIDHRMHARLRLMMDEIFGEDNFLNEIIWSYQTGGRARKHFSRKHDVILFYRKSKTYFFDLGPVAVEREGRRRNHMKRHIDTDGRVYRSIKSGGKVYTYYDDEPVYPGDVWDDVSHLQQKDPQRTGYDTQKPLPLLERIVLCASREGDLVCDLFAGSGTTLEAAYRHKRRFLGVDSSPAAIHVINKRLSGAKVNYHNQTQPAHPYVEAISEPGVGFYHVELCEYKIEPGAIDREFSGLDALDSWAVGYLRDGEYTAMAMAQRTKLEPKLKLNLQLPALDGVPMISTLDVLGRKCYFAIDQGAKENL